MSVGIDIGRSGVKIVSKGGTLPIIPAIACPAVSIDDREEALRVSRETVVVDGSPWMYGSAAAIHSGSEPGIYAGFEQTVEYEVLIAGALKTCIQNGIAINKVVAGVPSEAGQDVKDLVAGLFRKHGVESIRVIAQPAGALIAAAQVHPELVAEGSSTAIVDVGRYSTDIALSQNGRPVLGAYASVPGVRLAVDVLASSLRGKITGTASFEVLETALRTGKLVYAMKEIPCTAEIAAAKERLSADIKRTLQTLITRQRGNIQAVVLAGGGAELITLDVPVIVAAGRHAVARGFALLAEGL